MSRKQEGLPGKGSMGAEGAARRGIKNSRSRWGGNG